MNRLKQLRTENGLTQVDVSRELNITRQGYANYENEVTQPSPSILIKLADYFGCSIDYIVGREDESGNVNINSNLSFEESELLRIYRNSSEQNKKFLLTFAKGLGSGF